MASTIEQIMQAIGTAVATIDGLNVRAFSPGQITPPTACVMVPTIPKYHATMQRARYDLEFDLWVLTSAGLDETGQYKLAGYANPSGTGSIVSAIEVDKKLGGVVQDIHVVSFRPLGVEEVGAIGYFGGVFTLECQALGV